MIKSGFFWVWARVAFCFFRLCRKLQTALAPKAALAIAVVIVCFIAIKLYSINRVSTNRNSPLQNATADPNQDMMLPPFSITLSSMLSRHWE